MHAWRALHKRPAATVTCPPRRRLSSSQLEERRRRQARDIHTAAVKALEDPLRGMRGEGAGQRSGAAEGWPPKGGWHGKRRGRRGEGRHAKRARLVRGGPGPAAGGAPEEAEAHDDDDEEEEEGAEEEEEEEEAGRQQGGAPAAAPQQQDGEGHAGRRDAQQRPRARRMQTFVFSATLTLPANLRKRLRKGGGGASGSSDLDSLMDKIPFR